VHTEIFDILSTEGASLEGRLDLPEEPVRAYAVFAHCFTCSKHSIAAVRIAQALTTKGIGVLRFDFTGIGDVGNEFADTFSGNVEDVVMAAKALASAGRSPALLIGHSLGGAAVLAAAQRLPEVVAVCTIAAPFDVEHVKGLLGVGLDSAPSGGVMELGGRRIRVGRAFLDDLSDHDQGARIAHLDRPLLIFHAPRDDIVGIDNAAAIFTAAKHPKSFIALDGADHLLKDSIDAEYVADLLAAWIGRYLTQPRVK
jgi:alpha-beta hydrolase superfamily lysophospholipase